jgi:hypothetical protein
MQNGVKKEKRGFFRSKKVNYMDTCVYNLKTYLYTVIDVGLIRSMVDLYFDGPLPRGRIDPSIEAQEPRYPYVFIW